LVTVRRLVVALGACSILACGSGGGTADGGTDAGPDVAVEAGCGDTTSSDVNCGACGHACTGAQHCASGVCTTSKIEHVVLIVEENHTFDSYFGHYCKAAAGSNPSCTSGPSCCEGAPATEPHGASPIVLDDSSNFATDRDHQQACELQEIDDGKMDGYVTGSTGSDQCLGTGPSCSTTNNFAIAEQGTVGPYWTLASTNALADRWFQPLAGGSSSNDMYFATAHYQFTDNQAMPDTIGCLLDCTVDSVCLSAQRTTYQGRTTIGDVLVNAGRTFTVYADGYADAVAAGKGNCPNIAADCNYSEFTHPVAYQACRFDASDIPFEYYAQFADSTHIQDFSQFAKDITANKLPDFSYLKALTTRNEHPNVSNITDGISFVQGVLGTLAGSTYASSTLVLLTWDEGGGFFDHIAPPASIDTDDASKPVPYGTRVPMIAIGTFAKKGAVSHVTMEHSSVVRFLEYNFVGPVGQLGHNDAKVANIGSLLDPASTGVHVPE
jgi:phospholipase C